MKPILSILPLILLFSSISAQKIFWEVGVRNPIDCGYCMIQESDTVYAKTGDEIRFYYLGSKKGSSMNLSVDVDGYTIVNNVVFTKGKDVYTHVITKNTSIIIYSKTISTPKYIWQILIDTSDANRVDVKPGTKLCEGDTVTASCMNADTYLWSNNQTTQSISFIADKFNNTIAVSGKIHNTQFYSETIFLTVNPLPYIKASADTAIYLGYTAFLNVYGGDNFAWSPSVTVLDSIGSKVAVAPTENTAYIVSGMYNFMGCKNTDTVNVSVLLPTSLKNHVKNEIRIIPNPATNTIVIECLAPVKKALLINSTGQIMQSWIGIDNATQVDIRCFMSGLYIFQIETNEGTSRHKISITR